jgi:subtilisin family serine protease
VAPEVELGMYRIFPCVGSTGSDLVLAGLLDAADDGADIISLSLGSNSGWAVENPFERVITLLKERNIVTIIAQGNYGFAGPYWTGSPAISNDAIAVASTNAARYPTTYKFKDNKGGSFTYGSLWPLTTTLKAYTPPDDAEGLFSSIYGCSYQVLDAAVAELERRGWQPQETVILFKRGGQCGDTANSGAAAQYGFHATLFWAGEEQVNPEDNFFGSVVGLTASLYVNAVDGPSIHKSLLADPLGYQLVFSSTRFTPLDLGGTPNAVSNFSTWGAAWEVDRQKPDISAPGHLILSSWPLEDGGYAIISGTSMATPFAAGAYALLKSAYPNLSVDELRSTFASTANPTRWWADNRVIHSTLGQGAGLINVWKAYNSGALLNETRIVLGTTAKATRSFTIKNTLGRSKTFSITHEPAGLNERVPYPEAPREEWYTLGWISKAVYADVVFHTPTEFTLGAGETATVSFTVTAPDVDERYIPSYSGYITLTSGRDVYRASYYGVPYKFSDAAELFEQTKRDGVTLPALGVLNPNIGAPTIGSPYISFNNAEGRFFEVLFRTWQPFSAWRVDLIHHNTTFKPTIEAFPGVTFDNLTTSDFEVKEDWGGVQSLGYVGREGNFAPIDGWATIGGGFRDPTSGEVLTLAYPPGDYRLVLRVLRLDQDPTDPKSWDSWLSGIAHLEDEFPNS